MDGNSFSSSATNDVSYTASVFKYNDLNYNEYNYGMGFTKSIPTP